jgi:lipoprotein-anchoring transpeptidase ErfK/SrfK
MPTGVVGNEFVVAQPRLRPVVAAPAPVPAPIITTPSAGPVLMDLPLEFERTPNHAVRILEFMHHYSLGVFALLFLAVATAAILVGSSYWAAHISLTTATSPVHSLAQPLRGPNLTVKTGQLAETMQRVTTQPIAVQVAGKSLAISPDKIRSWVKVSADQQGFTYLHVNQQVITKTLNDVTAPYAKAAVNQVNVTNADGSATTIAAGQNGTKIGDISPLSQQLGSGLLAAKGFQITVPTETQAFAVVTPAAYDKLLEVNVDTHQMMAYEKGQLVKSWPISAGAPTTPTPIGQFKIYSKLTVQDMSGFNTDGSKYLQPHVHWINYFLPGGYAVHGNYWRPLSVFGSVNTSHGCVSLPDDQAKWVYDWAPVGTTVITHHS